MEYTRNFGIGVIIDEAYGDYLSKEHSWIDLVDKYENLIVIRTFSKGLGMARIRAGYIISNENTSICMLFCHEDIDLCQKFAEKGVKFY